MEYCSISEAAARIGISRRSLYLYWINKGLARVEIIVGHPAMRADEVERIKSIRMAKQEANASEQPS
ncbi:hypothetical protein SD70_29350 [Gordoniibacillus kamchatkensis]|uniref:Helix-turn-helix domain-containing protein n=1 Tax=Gordoniibacillus kamchatkensis TaxID=1590651 RepID=A0ABR5ABN0_9BACL|nr:hypothetical protein SD70_29350 [Paenibacillus sp. VKM B-2647]